MKSIKLQKIEIVEFKSLQLMLLNFVTHYSQIITSKSRDYDTIFDIILLLDLSSNLFYSFRSKIEKANKSTANFSCTCAEAVVLLKVCNNQNYQLNEYDSFVARKFTDLIHKELINLI